MSVSNNKAKKIGLIGSIAILISSVIGIGIFFKNDTVFKNNDNNAIGVLISWILSAIIAFCAALSFAEIGFGKKTGAGLAGAVEHLYGSKVGRFVNFNQNFFYIGILNISIAIFTAEAILNIFVKSNSVHIGFIFLIALGFLFIIILFNYFAKSLSAKSQTISTILKFLPLTVVALSGLIYGIMHPENSLFETNKTNSNNNISVQGILSSLPAILFAFDSFLSVGTIKNEMKDYRKQVPLTMIIGMLICVFFYLLITVSQILVSSGTANGVFETIFKNNQHAANAMNVFINVFIFISILGVLNALVMTGLRSFDQFVNNRICYGYWFLQKSIKQNTNLNGLLASIIIYGFWYIVLLIPSCILNTDSFIDGLSNFPTLFCFAIYGFVILKAIINRKTKTIKLENKVKGFLFVAPIATIGCFLAFGYQFFYAFSIDAFINPYGIIKWGLFFTNGYVTYKYIGAIWFLLSVCIFLITPFINDLSLKIKYNNIIKKMTNEILFQNYSNLKKELLV